MTETEFIIISGYSGSGKTTALKTLEDQGYYAVDNMPVSLLPAFAHLVDTGRSGINRAAMVMDVRGRDSLMEYPNVIGSLKDSGYRAYVVFLETAYEVLLKRFSETRRVHPLDPHIPLHEALEREKKLLEPLRNAADLILDTTDLGTHDLKRIIRERFRGAEDGVRMLLSLVSFGFKFGLPKESDIVFDARFLPNPFFVDELKEKNGRNEDVLAYVEHAEGGSEFIDRLAGFIEYLLPKYVAEGRGYLTVAVGCTGGQHRSVAIVERLSVRLSGIDAVEVRLRHRELREG